MFILATALGAFLAAVLLGATVKACFMITDFRSHRASNRRNEATYAAIAAREAARR